MLSIVSGIVFCITAGNMARLALAKASRSQRVLCNLFSDGVKFDNVAEIDAVLSNMKYICGMAAAACIATYKE